MARQTKPVAAYIADAVIHRVTFAIPVVMKPSVLSR